MKSISGIQNYKQHPLCFVFLQYTTNSNFKFEFSFEMIDFRSLLKFYFLSAKKVWNRSHYILYYILTYGLLTPLCTSFYQNRNVIVQGASDFYFRFTKNYFSLKISWNIYTCFTLLDIHKVYVGTTIILLLIFVF